MLIYMLFRMSLSTEINKGTCTSDIQCSNGKTFPYLICMSKEDVPLRYWVLTVRKFF